MLLRLFLSDFRNFSGAEFDLSAPVTVFTGKNGSGKSSLLEAVYLFSTLRSFRTNRLDELRKNGSAAFSLKLLLQKSAGWNSTYEIRGNPAGKSLLIDEKSVYKASSFAGAFQTVAFLPDDAELISGGPSARRSFLDRYLCITDREYYIALQNYRTALKSYNALLHAQNKDGRVYSAYASVMASEAGTLLKKRVAATEMFSKRIVEILAVIRPELSGVKLNYLYDEKLHSAEYFMQKLDSSFEKDQIRGATCIGPHRDELEISVNNLSHRTYGSRGQCRITALAMKLAELDSVYENTHEKPVVLVDDAFSDLDIPAKEMFLSRIFSAGQLFCAFTELPVEKQFQSAHIINLGELQS